MTAGGDTLYLPSNRLQERKCMDSTAAELDVIINDLSLDTRIARLTAPPSSCCPMNRSAFARRSIALDDPLDVGAILAALRAVGKTLDMLTE
ncbi:hypothetical protein AB0C27_55965 [Nonomuraea sp. NPDC048882]|uniref:hypothetical protein n=1 Tax=Nonomuraea sp. NPDC048882 TaxID=3154347 RepID=UPI0033E22F14